MPASALALLLAASSVVAQEALEFLLQPPSAVSVGAPFSVSIRAIDDDGDTDDDFDEDVRIELDNNPGVDGASLGGQKQVEADDGIATFRDLTVNKAGSGYTLTVRAESDDSGEGSDDEELSATSRAFSVTSSADALEFQMEPPTTATSGETFTVQVRATTSFGTDLTFFGTITLELGNNPGGDGVLNGDLTEAASFGVATFNGLSIDQVDNGYTIVATSPGLTSATSIPFNVIPAPATQLEFGQQPTDTAEGDIISPPVTVRALDPNGNLDTNFDGEITLSIQSNPGGGSLDGDVSKTAVNGVSTFDDLSIDEVGDGYTLAASAPGLTGDTSASFDITPDPAVALQFGQQPTNTQAGETITPAVTVRAVDAENDLDTSKTGSVTIALGANPGGDGQLDGTLTRPFVNGVATFNGLNIDEVDNGYTLRATSSGLTAATSNNFNITAGPAVALAFQVQPSSEAAGSTITPPVRVRAIDAGGNTATDFNGNISLQIQNNPGGGTLAGTTTRLASNGVATFNNLSIDQAGNGYTLRANSPSLAAATSTSFNITPGSPSAATSTITANPTSITANGSSTSTITVQLKDQFGNNATNANCGGMTLSTTAGTLSGLTNAGGGRCTATLTSSTSVQTATVTGRIGGQTIADDATVQFIAGSANRLQFQQQPPTNVGAGAPFQVAVRVVDQNNNTVTGFNGAIALSIAANPGGGTLTGDTSNNAVNGVATFPGLSIDRSGSGYTLAAASGGLAGATSSAFNVVPGAPSGANSTIIAEPTEIPADGSSTSTITVDLFDAFGNDITTGGANVALSTSGGTLGPVTDNGDGTYTAPLRSSTVSQTAIVSGTVNGQTIADNASVTFTSGSATTLDILVQPSDTPVGVTIAPAVSVRVADGSGNTVTSFTGNVTVALAVNPTGATLQGTTTVAAVNGVATFGNLSINRTGSYALSFTSAGIGGVTSETFVITGGAPSTSTSTITAVPQTIAADGSSTSTITVQLKDAAGNDLGVGGATVRLTATAGTLSPVTDEGDGTYTAELTSTATPQTATIQGTLNGAAIADTATVTFTTGSTDLEVTVTASDPTPTKGGTLVYTVRIVNRGPETATGVELTDELPDRVTFVSAEASQGTYTSTTGVWSLGTLASGASATLEITVTVN